MKDDIFKQWMEENFIDPEEHESYTWFDMHEAFCSGWVEGYGSCLCDDKDEYELVSESVKNYNGHSTKFTVMQQERGWPVFGEKSDQEAVYELIQDLRGRISPAIAKKLVFSLLDYLVEWENEIPKRKELHGTILDNLQEFIDENKAEKSDQ